MRESEPGKRVEIIINASDRWQGRPLATQILEVLRREGAAGATVAHAFSGFASHRGMQTLSTRREPGDLPIVLVWVDTPARVERLLPKIREVMQGGSLTIQDVTWFRGPRAREPVIAGDTHVADVMTTQVTTTTPEMTVAEVARVIAGKNYRGLPVIDEEKRVVGILSETDLVQRAGFRGGRWTQGTELRVRDVMTKDVVTVSPDATLLDAAALMVDRRVRRLPVTQDGRLVGIVSRFDLLRMVSKQLDVGRGTPVGGVSAETQVSEVMHTAVPTVLEDDTLNAVGQTVGSSAVHVAVVLDQWRHVVGLITDAELVEHLVPASPGRGREREAKRAHRLGEPDVRLQEGAEPRARDLMRGDVATTFGDTQVGQALQTMMEAKQKVLPVVDDAWRLVGMVDRVSLLTWLAHGAEGGA